MKKTLIALSTIIFAVSLTACGAKQVTNSNLETSSIPIMNENYNVEKVAKKTTQPAVPTDLESLPIGTQFMCYPQQEFDFIARGQFASIDFVDVPVHISSMNAVLTEKRSFEEFRLDPTKGVASQGTYIFAPYVVTITISGYVDPSFGVKAIQPIITTNAEQNTNYLSPTNLDENGNFTMTVEKYWNSPVTIWFGGAYLMYSTWSY